MEQVGNQIMRRKIDSKVCNFEIGARREEWSEDESNYVIRTYINYFILYYLSLLRIHDFLMCENNLFVP